MNKISRPPFAQVPKWLITAAEIDDTTFRILAHLEGEKDKPSNDGKPWTFSAPAVAKVLNKPNRTVRSKFRTLADQGVLVRVGVLDQCRQRVPIYQYRSDVLQRKCRTAAIKTAVEKNDGGGVSVDGGTNGDDGGRIEQERRQRMPYSKNDGTENDGTKNNSTKSPAPLGSLSESFRVQCSKVSPAAVGGAHSNNAARLGGEQLGLGSTSSSSPRGSSGCAERRIPESEKQKEPEPPGRDGAADPAAPKQGSIPAGPAETPRSAPVPPARSRRITNGIPTDHELYCFHTYVLFARLGRFTPYDSLPEESKAAIRRQVAEKRREIEIDFLRARSELQNES